MTTVERIDAILSERKISRRQIAAAAHIPTSTFQSAMARGKNITVEMVFAIANALDVDVYSLLDWDSAARYIEKDIASLISAHGELSIPLLSAFDSLNEEGKKRAVERLEELTEIPKYKG